MNKHRTATVIFCVTLYTYSKPVLITEPLSRKVAAQNKLMLQTWHQSLPLTAQQTQVSMEPVVTKSRRTYRLCIGPLCKKRKMGGSNKWPDARKRDTYRYAKKYYYGLIDADASNN